MTASRLSLIAALWEKTSVGWIFMTLLLVVGWGAFAYSARRRWRLLMIGQPANRFDQPVRRIQATLQYAIAQMRMRRYPLSGFAHTLVFTGFIVLLLRTLMLWGRGYDPDFSLWVLGLDTWAGKLYALLKDIFAVLVIVGALIFFYFRLVVKLPRLTHNLDGIVILGIILTMMLSDIFYDGTRIVLDAREAALAGVPLSIWEPAGSVAALIVQGLPDGVLRAVEHLGFWTHSALVLVFLNVLPYSKHFHIITAIPNVYLQDLTPRGRLRPIDDLEGRVEREETLGVRRIDQFSWKALLDLYTCTECGRCSDVCPATSTGKKLSPKHFTIDLRDFLYEHQADFTGEKGKAAAGGNGQSATDQAEASSTDGNGQAPHRVDLVGKVIDPEVVWACTSCRACEEECPVFISYVDKFVDLRRHLVQERGEFPETLQAAFRGLESNMNPWGFSPSDRAGWAQGLDLPLLSEKPDAPVLFWVGCAPSYDDRAKSTARATARLLKSAGVDFAILGPEESCTGDPARRAGNEYLYQILAKANVEILNNYGADKKTIITTCPHCFNTLRNEYPDFGGRYNVIHHSEFLARLVREGKLRPQNSVNQQVTFHDSCYLGRYNDVYDAPRETLRAIPGLTILEPAKTRDRGMCCGAGGAQMFKEEEPGRERVNLERTDQLLATGAEVVASACPFCMRMLTDGLSTRDRTQVRQVDIAELLLESVGEPARSNGN